MVPLNEGGSINFDWISTYVHLNSSHVEGEHWLAPLEWLEAIKFAPIPIPRQ